MVKKGWCGSEIWREWGWRKRYIEVEEEVQVEKVEEAANGGAALFVGRVNQPFRRQPYPN